MTLVPKREYLTLLMGDIAVFFVSLWFTLFIRYFAIPSKDLFTVHLAPFALFFIAWLVVFFLAGLYGKHTRLFRSKLPTIIISAQFINILIAALFFFFVPVFGIAPKTNLVLYLVISTTLIVLWRLGIYPQLRSTKKYKGVLIASGPDAKALAEEIGRDHRYPFSFEYVIDTSRAPTHEIIQRACRVAEEDDVTFVVVDYADAAVSAALPIIYDAAFHKRKFALIDVLELYQEVFDCVPLSLTRYAWVLGQVGASRAYDLLKRGLDVVIAIIIGVLSLVVYPFVALAIKMEDGGPYVRDIFHPPSSILHPR